jgi:hypothetical protein
MSQSDVKRTIEKSMYWWLSPRRPFLISDEYSIELLRIDYSAGTAKIQITNLKNKTTQESDLELPQA